MSPDIILGNASAGGFAGLISVLGVLAAVAWVGWRFGPTLLRVSGWCSFWVAWAVGGEGGYGYCLAFLILGSVLWGGGTIWYGRRRGRWPSVVSRRILHRVPGARSLACTECLPDSGALRRQP